MVNRRKMNAQLKALLQSYGRSVLGAAIALYMSGVTDPGKLALSLVAAIAPVAIRYFNPNDKAFGKAPKAEEVDAALKTASAESDAVKVLTEAYAKAVTTAKRAPAKKPAAKKAPNK